MSKSPSPHRAHSPVSSLEALAQSRSEPRTTPQAVPLPDDVDSFIASYQPTWDAQQIRKAFDEMSNVCGGFDGAVKHYRKCKAAFDAGNVLGLEAPPANAVVKEVTVGRLVVFYHPGPNHRDAGAQFLWSAYIGWREKKTIIPTTDWAKHGIRVEIMHNGNWKDCGMLLPPPLTRVRFTYNELNGQRTTQEVVFPPNPREPIPVQYLKY
ncbi:hypothetical protein DFH06DRAFT_695301 [Mycena polygramma]|nr:hypothetical protein DFH06DRAFT_695301 [Mycena polygramma]